MRTKVTDGEVLPWQLTCPCVEPEWCTVTLLPQDVRRCLDSDKMMERYERLTLQRLADT